MNHADTMSRGMCVRQHTRDPSLDWRCTRGGSPCCAMASSQPAASTGSMETARSTSIIRCMHLDDDRAPAAPASGQAAEPGTHDRHIGDHATERRSRTPIDYLCACQERRLHCQVWIDAPPTPRGCLRSSQMLQIQPVTLSLRYPVAIVPLAQYLHASVQPPAQFSRARPLSM
jgi:hypothetical protein